ncbi:MAG: DUF655 domain-containing protein [Candidatus Aenigmarchaeota archaeon]|nr:DUF655 domain-containing protein [Candidatus Aenigmarchaeota archaeon]
MPFLKDENVIVLDFLPSGHATGKREPIAQVIGKKYFSLLEVVIRKGITVKNGDVLYVGKDKREKVDHIKRRISVKDLTSFARSELEFVIEKIVTEDEQRFVDFFNKSVPISTRMHQIELLPGFGKKHMFDILEERKKSPFKNFEDIRNRVKLLPDPKKSIIKRILEELEDENIKHRIFVAGPSRR